MKKVKVEDAVGMVLAHDLTRIVPGEFKGVAFKKGHVIREEDIEKLKDMGKNNIYILDIKENELHEDDAAFKIAEHVSGEGLYFEGPSEGKVSLKAEYDGILKVNVEGLEEVNSIDLLILSTLHNNSLVRKGQVVAGTRIIPLIIDKEKINKIKYISEKLNKIIRVKKFKPLKIGAVVTGSEVYEGRIKDQFGPVFTQKIKDYGGILLEIRYAPDNQEKIEEEINYLIESGADVVLTSGGMSVDPDDVTPSAIRNVSNNVITYGSPVLPGAMFMLAYKDNVAIMGIPACGMYHKATILDLTLPRILSGEILTRRDIAKLGHGGLCLNCEVCNYPVCPFGK
ncbi:molybdopterin binding domain-containing protein [Gottschalkia purinilytica]|uniref:Molybdopterin molybdenumtransferase n=1 Tax=Gottschalkia purinilytica TaxID=1503 RepID=A0A0L0W6I2_GOTPU|nr:molybdopterin-binding protein [Gottschalkia purinilytica]KNF07101.1 molybdopterin binding domain-containing protein [Gottschalkia purinilytica]